MMIFQEETEEGGVSSLKPVYQGDSFGVLTEPVVILHSLTSSEYVNQNGIDGYHVGTVV